jgi:hypothetical protein
MRAWLTGNIQISGPSRSNSPRKRREQQELSRLLPPPVYPVKLEELLILRSTTVPLIKPDVRISRIRLSDRVSSWSHTQARLASNSEPVNEPTTLEPQCPRIAPESPQSVPETSAAPSPIPLPSAFWQALLYGSRDALLSSRDANTALCLVAFELGKGSDVVRFSDSVRVNTLRKMLDQQFGAKAWDVINRLWRAAPPSLGAPTPNEDQSYCSPGLKDCPRSMPAWRREFNQQGESEQRLLESMGSWCG